MSENVSAWLEIMKPNNVCRARKVSQKLVISTPKNVFYKETELVYLVGMVGVGWCYRES